MSTRTLQSTVTDTTSNGVVDLDEAEIHSLWDPAKNIACWTIVRDASYVMQLCLTSLPIWFADLLAVTLTLAVSTTAFSYVNELHATASWFNIGGWCFAFSTICLLTGLYPAVGMNSAKEIGGLIRASAAVTLLRISYDLMRAGDHRFLFVWPVAGILIALTAPFARGLFRMAVCRSRWWGLRTILVGSGPQGELILREIKKNPKVGFKVVAVVDRYRSDWSSASEEIDQGVTHISSQALEDTPELSRKFHACCGIFAGSEFPERARLMLIDSLTSIFPQLYVTTDSAEAGRSWSGLIEIGRVRFLCVTERLLMPGARLLKRALDIAVILIAAPIVVPVVALLALMVKLSSKGPAFYSHTRLGRNGRSIKVWKLRSMVQNADVLLKQYLADHPHLKSDWERLHKLPNDPRVTSIGKILRKTSLDEIPQLWNVFRGDMSLVGPRPIVEAEIQKYKAAYPLYTRVTPGITGLWQVNGRNSTTYEERILYDVEYVRNWSLTLDLCIIARTIVTVITCDGAC